MSETALEPTSSLPAMAIMWAHLGANYDDGAGYYDASVSVPVGAGWISVHPYRSDATGELAYSLHYEDNTTVELLADVYDRHVLASLVPFLVDLLDRARPLWR